MPSKAAALNRELAETERHNRAEENIATAKVMVDAAGHLIKAATGSIATKALTKLELKDLADQVKAGKISLATAKSAMAASNLKQERELLSLIKRR